MKGARQCEVPLSAQWRNPSTRKIEPHNEQSKSAAVSAAVPAAVLSLMKTFGH